MKTVQSIGSLAADLVNSLADKTGRDRPFAERIPIVSRKQWLTLRKQDITASAAAALLGIHPFATAYAVWAEKTDAIAEPDEMTAAMERGLELEPIAIRRLEKLHPSWSVEQPRAYYRDPRARLGATPDCFATDPTRKGFGVVQVKSVEPGKFRKDWRDEEGEVTPPLWIVCQAIIEAHLTGASWAAVAALVISYGIELHFVEVPLHAGIIERIKSETAAFWQMIAEGRRPDPDYGRDADLIAKLFDDPADIEVDLTSDNELPETVAEYTELGSSISELNERRKVARAEILHKLGNAAAARIATGRITAKTVKRKAYTVAATTYRSIRFKEKAE